VRRAVTHTLTKKKGQAWTADVHQKERKKRKGEVSPAHIRSGDDVTR